MTTKDKKAMAKVIAVFVVGTIVVLLVPLLFSHFN